MGYSKHNLLCAKHFIAASLLIIMGASRVWAHEAESTVGGVTKPNPKTAQSKDSKAKSKPVNSEEKKEKVEGSDSESKPNLSDSSNNEVVPSLIFSATQGGAEEFAKTENNSASSLTESESTASSNESTLGVNIDPEAAKEKASKALTDLVDRADKNIETSVATTPEDLKNGNYNANDSLSSLSSITYHTNNTAICLKSGGGGKPDGANCEKWLEPEISIHGESSDSSPLEDIVKKKWDEVVNNITEKTYRIWDIALKAKENLFDEHGRLNTQGLSKFELKEEVAQAARELGTKSAEQGLRMSLGDNAPKEGETVSPPSEALRAMAVNISRAIVNHSTAKWSELQAAKKGVEVLKSDSIDEKKYKSEVENGENMKAAGEERLLVQAPLDTETQGLSLEERTSRAESLKKVGTEVINPTFEGDKLVQGNPNEEDIKSWAYRATVEQMANPFMNSNEISKPEDIQLSERQIAAELAVGPDSENDQEQKVTYKAMTPRQQIEAYNRQLDIAAENMKRIAAESSSFVDTSEKIRANKLKEGETILTINDLTPSQKKELNQGKTPLSANPNVKVQIPRSASQLTITKY